MTKEELVDLVKKLMNGKFRGDDEGSELMQMLERNVLHPRVSDLIFWDERELTAEEIVEEALAYKPIQLPDSFE